MGEIERNLCAFNLRALWNIDPFQKTEIQYYMNISKKLWKDVEIAQNICSVPVKLALPRQHNKRKTLGETEKLDFAGTNALTQIEFVEVLEHLSQWISFTVWTLFHGIDWIFTLTSCPCFYALAWTSYLLKMDEISKLLHQLIKYVLMYML